MYTKVEVLIYIKVQYWNKFLFAVTLICNFLVINLFMICNTACVNFTLNYTSQRNGLLWKKIVTRNVFCEPFILKKTKSTLSVNVSTTKYWPRIFWGWVRGGHPPVHIISSVISPPSWVRPRFQYRWSGTKLKAVRESRHREAQYRPRSSKSGS